MSLTETQLEQITAHMMGKGGCVRCDESAIKPSEIVGLNRPNQLGGYNIPCVVMACMSCGHIELISAKIAGVTV